MKKVIVTLLLFACAATFVYAEGGKHRSNNAVIDENTGCITFSPADPEDWCTKTYDSDGVIVYDCPEVKMLCTD